MPGDDSSQTFTIQRDIFSSSSLNNHLNPKWQSFMNLFIKSKLIPAIPVLGMFFFILIPLNATEDPIITEFDESIQEMEVLIKSREFNQAVELGEQMLVKAKKKHGDRLYNGSASAYFPQDV